ncbi:hypothetical protein [Thalassobacillus sp. C254]|uniref:hypothetical protein n=1 Tax=Thalassobacillus sp. C254 TaxID=1225341 RepID=UPI0022B70777|nr:hypothetical protein [Thalassobacillus sp. C254]
MYLIWPDRYKEQEEMEERFRQYFEKNVSILTRNGSSFTLREYRKQMDKNGIEKFLKEPDETVPCVCSYS